MVRRPTFIAGVFRDFSSTIFRNDEYDTPLERYRSGAPSICRTLSLILHGLRGISNGKNASTLFLVFGSRKESNFLTVCRNDAYDTPLDSYGVGASSTCWTLYEILHGFEGIWKTVCCPRLGSGCFRVNFFDSFVRSMILIHGWIALVEALHFHVKHIL